MAASGDFCAEAPDTAAATAAAHARNRRIIMGDVVRVFGISTCDERLMYAVRGALGTVRLRLARGTLRRVGGTPV